ncbi:MAG: 2-oxoacid:ferredoxin oxidoreductase subunit beta [Myxococcota bacterium]|nr:2-oxoacid:ferredoxin oxidoreductase subunit beta [Myxococcota bacterium]
MSQYPIGREVTPLSRKDLQSNQEVRWCLGCGDYAILKQVQSALSTLEVPRENFVFVSGIGCSSRFPYYMNTFGLHTIHGRAPAFATGIKALRPELNVWVVTGDGDALSIGGNQLIHLLRRNLDLTILLFNNQIYGLTKGQYSPTSERGKVTKSTPAGSLEAPLRPLQLALGAQATFLARAVDIDGPLLQDILARAAAHRGTALVEIYQNCNIFNDDAFIEITERGRREESQLRLQHGAPLRFGKDGRFGLRYNARGELERCLVEEVGVEALCLHDEESSSLAWQLASMEGVPTPLGVLRAVDAPRYEEGLAMQIKEAEATRSTQSRRAALQALFESGDCWEVGPR